MGSEMKKIKSSNFARTCNRFSQFLKERRSSSIGDIAAFNGTSSMVVASPKPNNNEMMSLLCPIEEHVVIERKSLELFPLTSSSSDQSTKNVNENDSSTETSEMDEDRKKITTSSMTIIYDGKMLVVDKMSEDMAQEIISLALAANGAVSTPQHVKTPQINNNAITTNFPMARRVSLHRFMEKRKERIAASAPYQVQSSRSHHQPEKNFQMKSYKQQEEEQLELKL